MHLKSCYALFLLALVACQAAPPQPEIIEKKSIGEETSKISKNLKLEDHGADKDRAKKSATFCVEIHSNQQVPCKENQPSVVQMVQPLPFKEVTRPVSQPIQVLRPHVPSPPQTVHLVQPQAPSPPPQTVHLIQQAPAPPPPPPQTIHLVQSETPSPHHQTFHVFKTETPTPPPQTFHVLKTETPTPPPQTIHVIHPQKSVSTSTPRPQPAPIKVEPFPLPATAAHTTNIILPAPHLQPAPQPANIVLPPQPVHQPPMNFYSQPAPPQQAPIVNIVPVPTPGCNQHLTVQPQSAPQPPTVIHQETKTEPIKIQEMVKPPKPEKLPVPKPKVIQFLPLENTPCQQEILVQPRPIMLIEPPMPVQQLATLNQCNRPHHLVTGCTCPQNIAFKSQGSHVTSHSWPRTHSKIHEHHVMLYPSASTMPATMPLMSKIPYSLMSLNENPSPIIFAPQAAQPESRYGDTIISIHGGENSHSYPIPYSSYPPNAPTVINTYPSVGGPIYRQAQSMDTQQHTLLMNEGQDNLIASEITNPSKDPKDQKRGAVPIQFKENEQKDFTEVEETKQE